MKASIIRLMCPGFTLSLALALPVTSNGQYILWSTNLDGIAIRQFYLTNSVPTTVTIPDTITGMPVTQIGPDAFVPYFANSFITNLVIPDSIHDIDAGAFETLEYLASVTIGTGITNLFNNAFANIGNGVISPPNPAPPERVGFYFRGNAPNLLDPTVFFRDAKATVYYLPGTSGWSNTFGGLPTAVWMPQMQVVNPNGTTNQIGFNVNWANGKSVVIEGSTDLTNPKWYPVATNVVGTVPFSPQPTNSASGFYRVRSQ